MVTETKYFSKPREAVMTKFQKRITVSVISVICVMAILFLSCAICIASRRHRTKSEVVVETFEFLPKPDSAVLFQGLSMKKFSQDETADIYDTYMHLMVSLYRIGTCLCYFDEDDVWKYMEEYPCLEFRYDQPQKFVGILDSPRDEDLLGVRLDRPFEFDAMMLVFEGEHLALVGCRNGQYFGIDRLHINLSFSDKDKFDQLKNLVLQ